MKLERGAIRNVTRILTTKVLNNDHASPFAYNYVCKLYIHKHLLYKQIVRIKNKRNSGTQSNLIGKVHTPGKTRMLLTLNRRVRYTD